MLHFWNEVKIKEISLLEYNEDYYLALYGFCSSQSRPQTWVFLPFPVRSRSPSEYRGEVCHPLARTSTLWPSMKTTLLETTSCSFRLQIHWIPSYSMTSQESPTPLWCSPSMPRQGRLHWHSRSEQIQQALSWSEWKPTEQVTQQREPSPKWGCLSPETRGHLPSFTEIWRSLSSRIKLLLWALPMWTPQIQTLWVLFLKIRYIFINDAGCILNLMEEILKLKYYFIAMFKCIRMVFFLIGRKWTHYLRVAWNRLGAILLWCLFLR